MTLVGLISTYLSIIFQDIDALLFLKEEEPQCFVFIIGEVSFYFISFVSICFGFGFINIRNEALFSGFDICRLFLGIVWVFIGMGFCWSNEMQEKSE